MAGNFYATLAQVLPLLLLAFIWDSGFLARLRRQKRPLRGADTEGVLFWSKPRVRVYTLVVTGTVIVSTALSVLVLAGLVPDSRALRACLSGGLILVLLTLMTRITVDVLWATAPGAHQADESGDEQAGEHLRAGAAPPRVASDSPPDAVGR